MLENFNKLIPFEDIPEAFTPGYPILCPLAEMTWRDIVEITDRTSWRNYGNLIKEDEL